MEYFLAFVVLFYIFSTQNSTKIVLLDNDKINNEIVIKNGSGTKVLNRTNSYVTIDSNRSKPSEIKQFTDYELKREYGDLLSNDNVPISVLFYFKSGNDELTKSSKKELEKIRKIIIDRYPCSVSVIGHADRQGDDKMNIKLSIKRAEKIANWIEDNNLKVNQLDIKSYGEMDPIVPTKDGVSEPKNRRVEVLIK